MSNKRLSIVIVDDNDMMRAILRSILRGEAYEVIGEARNGMSMGDLARYLMVSRQNLTGVIGRLERDGRIRVDPDPRDRRSRLIRMTEEGEQVWHKLAVPKIHRFYADALDGFAMTDLVHTTHYLMKLLDNMERLDGGPQDD